MTTEALCKLRDELRPGDRVLVSAGELSQPPRALPDAEAVFVAFAEDPSTSRPCVVVCGLPDGWADEPNEPLGLRALWVDRLRWRLTDDERVERMRECFRSMAMAVGTAGV